MIDCFTREKYFWHGDNCRPIVNNNQLKGRGMGGGVKVFIDVVRSFEQIVAKLTRGLERKDWEEKRKSRVLTR